MERHRDIFQGRVVQSLIKLTHAAGLAGILILVL